MHAKLITNQRIDSTSLFILFISGNPGINFYKFSISLTLLTWKCSGRKVSTTSWSGLAGWTTDDRKPSKTFLIVNFFIFPQFTVPYHKTNTSSLIVTMACSALPIRAHSQFKFHSFARFVLQHSRTLWILPNLPSKIVLSNDLRAIFRRMRYCTCAEHSYYWQHVSSHRIRIWGRLAHWRLHRCYWWSRNHLFMLSCRNTGLAFLEFGLHMDIDTKRQIDRGFVQATGLG